MIDAMSGLIEVFSAAMFRWQLQSKVCYIEKGKLTKSFEMFHRLTFEIENQPKMFTSWEENVILIERYQKVVNVFRQRIVVSKRKKSDPRLRYLPL